jgi:hypothetical protein
MLSFDYSQFVKLTGEALARYMTPILYSDSVKVPSDAIDNMLQDLHRYDEFHLVFALELGALRAPKLFAAHVPGYLTHREQSVRLAASRILERLPAEHVNHDLIKSVREAIKLCPEREHMMGMIDGLIERLGRAHK